MRATIWLRFVGVVILAGSALASAACASMTINRVLADPSRYRDREVQLSGAVVDSYSVASRGAYRLDDDTGQLGQGIRQRDAPQGRAGDRQGNDA